jgi:outer membrane protein assembly factor BamB
MSSIVTAWDAASGKELWRKPAGAVQPMFHTAMSPLVDGKQMILHVGGHNDGARTAFEPATGKVLWEWKGDGPAYGSPIIAEIGGARHLMLFSQKNFIGINPASGELLWSVPFEARSTTNSITPLVYGGNTVIVSGQGKPLTAYIVANKGGKWVADLAWENTQLSMSFSNAVLVGDSIFSLSPLNSGQFFWADAKSGKTLWVSEPRQAGNAAITRSGDLLFVLKDDGTLMVGKATPCSVCAGQDVYRSNERNMGASGHFRKPDLREGCRFAGAVDAELKNRGSDPLFSFFVNEGSDPSPGV